MGRRRERQSSNRAAPELRRWAIAVLVTLMFTASLSQFILSTAAPTIVADLHGLALYGWLFAAPAVASTVAMPVSGKLSDVYGRRPFALWGSFLYVVGSLAGGFAPSMPFLVGARVVSGVGAGVMVTVSAAMIADIFPPRQVPRGLAIWMVAFGAGSISGPFVGGVITDHVGWRWVFFGTAPLGAIAGVLGWLVLPRVRVARNFRVDYLGIVLIVCGLIALLFGLTWGGETYPWTSWQILVLAALSVLLLGSFVQVERHVEHPLLEPSMLKHPVFVGAVTVCFLVGAAQSSAMNLIPLFAQGVMGLTAQDAGLILVPMLAAQVLSALVGARVVERTGNYRLVAVTGTGVVVLGYVVLVTIPLDAGATRLGLAALLIGAGVGSSLPIMMAAVQMAFPHRLVGAVNSARQLFLSLGGSLGVTVASAILVHVFSSELQRRTPAAVRAALEGRTDPRSVITPSAQARVRGRLVGLDNGDGLFKAFVHDVRASLHTALTHAFLVGLALAILGLCVAAGFMLVNLRSPAARPDPAGPLAEEV
jgi:EmrB/QacA subfamily drug resistance transporter